MASQAFVTEQEEVELGRFHWPASASPEATVPGLVLIHDVFGLSEHSVALAADLASEGFGVLEIDLYRGMGEVKIEDPGVQIRSLSDPEILADLDAGADWLKAAPRCAGRKVGVIGVCMGGTYTLLAACRSDRFAAAAPFYGILSYEKGLLFEEAGRDLAKKPESPMEAAGRLRTPMIASFATEDVFVPNEDVEQLREVLASSGVSFEIDCYAGVGHAFMNRTRPAAYSEEAATRAWSRVIPFLRERLT